MRGTRQQWAVWSVFFLVASILPGLSSGSAAKERTLKISHQFAEADVRNDICKVFASKVETATKGELKFNIYPSSSLYKAGAQFDAMRKGALDFSVFPLAYASGKVPELDITLMPCIITSVEEGMDWRNRKIGQKVEEICEKSGMKILTWLWYAGGIGTMGKPIIEPDDVKGFKMRAAGKQFEYMLHQAGASITSMPSSEIYTALQTLVLDACLTSSTSFISYRLYEQLQYFNSPENYAIWYMAEPLVVSTHTWKSFSPAQQEIIAQIGLDLSEKALKDSVAANQEVAKVMKESKVKVHAMTLEEWKRWEELAKRSSWKNFADTVKGGKDLLDLAKQ